MKKKGPSNVFTVPNWMLNLRAKAPEGRRTPDQVASSLELSWLLHEDLDMLVDLIHRLIPQVPLKRQPFMHALLVGDVLANVQAFIDKSNEALAKFAPEVVTHEPEEQPAGTSGQSDLCSPDGDWGDHRDRSGRFKPSSRGNRALRAAKRQQAEA